MGLGLVQPHQAPALGKSTFHFFPPAWTQLHQCESAVSTSEWHTHTPNPERNQVQLVVRLHPPRIKLNAIESEHNSLLSSGVDWKAEPNSESVGEVRSQMLRVGVRREGNLQSGRCSGPLSLSHGTVSGVQHWVSPPCWGRSCPVRAVAVEQLSCYLAKPETCIWLPWTIW
jgi:hypothetical protein